MDTSHNYELQRDALIAKDRSLRYDTAAYSRAGILHSTLGRFSIQMDICADNLEWNVDKKIRTLRKWEIDNVWNVANPMAAKQDPPIDLFPGMGFLTG